MNFGIRQLDRFASLFAMSLAAAALFIAPAASAQQRVVFGTPVGFNDQSVAVAVAIEKGFYKEHGIDAEVVQFKGGAAAIQALAGGAIQFCICAPEHVIRLRNRGVPAVIAFPLFDSGGYALMASKKAGFKSLQDLKGKQIGVTSAGSKSDNLLRLALKRANLDADKDVEIVSIGADRNQIAAIKTNRISAGMITGYDLVEAEKTMTPVFDWRPVQLAGLALLADESWTKEHSKLVSDLIEATEKARTLLLGSRAERVAGLTLVYPNVDKAMIEKGADALPATLVKTNRFQKKSYDALLKDILELEPDLKPVPYETANPVLTMAPAAAGK